MKAFVTGSTGFLGVTLIEQLLAAGWEVIAFHRATSELSELLRLQQAGQPLQFAVGDVTDLDSLRRAVPEGVDALFHAAGSVGFLEVEDERAQYAVNAGGTRHAVQVAFERRVRRFIHTSSVLTYDFSGGKRVSERSAPNTSTKYAYIHSKYLADLEVDEAVKRGLDAVVMHPSAIFGAYDKATWSKMFREVQRGLRVPLAPPGAMSVCHMAKVADAHLRAFARGRTGEHYVLGGPDSTTMNVVRQIAALLGRPGPLLVVPAPLFKLFGRLEHRLSTALGREPMVTPPMADILCEAVYCDSHKAIDELGYQPASLDTMLRDCHQWMIETGRLPPPHVGHTVRAHA